MDNPQCIRVYTVRGTTEQQQHRYGELCSYPDVGISSREATNLDHKMKVSFPPTTPLPSKTRHKLLHMMVSTPAAAHEPLT